MVEKTAAESGRDTLAVVTQAAGHKPPPKEQTHPQSSHREKPPSVAEPCTAATPADMGVLAGIHSPVSDESALHSAALSRSPAGPPPEGKAIPAVARQPKGWMSGNSEVPPPQQDASGALSRDHATNEPIMGGPSKNEGGSPGEDFLDKGKAGSIAAETTPGNPSGTMEPHGDGGDPGDVADKQQLDVVGRSASATTEGTAGAALQPGNPSRSVDDKARGLPGWQNRLAGTGLTKNWEAFKNRNPNTVQHGIKIAGAVEKLREQAQEQIRKTQEQMRKQQELKKAPTRAADPKPSGKQA